MAFVTIVTSDTGWILERLAREIECRVPYVKYSQQVDPSASIQYYMTYSRRQERVSPIEVAYFAHLEPDTKTKERFFDVARAVEYCVCHAELYARVLRDAGIETVTAISPGVDLDRFVPRVKIGVVGRTYHTGRKGERLVAKVMDIPGIDWFFTGEGWPGPALEIESDRLPEFYRSLDYVLVPSLYEGGPMCVVEALACGTPVIAPPIGWVGEFPHIEYETGNADDLRRVLREVVAERTRLRASVLDRTWEAWAEGHDRLFSRLLREAGLAPGSNAGRLAEEKRPRSAQLILHGSEGASLGGPTVRVPRTAGELRALGLAAQAVRFPGAEIGRADILHGFNIWSPKSSLELARRARWLNKPFVFSPIFLDLSERQLWQEDLLSVFEANTDAEQVDGALEDVLQRHRTETALWDAVPEPIPGYHALAREVVDAADHLIFLSEHEKSLFERIGIRPRRSTIVRNPVDAAMFGTGDPSLFHEATGLNHFVLCVARIEPRKNQLMLVHALRDTGLPVVLVGHISSPKYGDLVRKHGGDRVHFAGRLEPGSNLLKSALVGARVLVLPSWAEGAPLVALEGAAAGASMVLSSRSGEGEYFGQRARYCDPANVESIRSAVLDAYETAWGEADREGLKTHVAENFSWQRYARGTLEVYRQTFEEFAARDTTTRKRTLSFGSLSASRTEIVVDLTTTANHRGRWTGIARFEMALTHALALCRGVELHLVAWADSARRFIPVPFDAVQPDYIAAYVSRPSAHHDGEFHFSPGAIFIVGGSGWMQNPRYTEAVTLFAAERQLVLTPIFHDVIPCRFPFWFNDGYAPIFEENLAILLSSALRILAVSENTRRDLEAFAIERNIFLPEVQVFREGDSIEIPGIAGPDVGAEKLAQIQALIGSAPFALTVGAIHARKNHRLLYDIWVRLADVLGSKCPHLVLVGGVAWNGHDVARMVRSDRRIKKFIHIVEDVDDQTLSWLYANCIFTLYPSLYEGWGLPVGESLRFGKICIASKIPSVLEIAPELTDLIDPLDFKAWYTTILFYAGSASARQQREEEIRAHYRPTEWIDSARQVIKLLRAPAALGGVPNLCTPGSPIRLNELGTALVKTGSWFATESWGSWSSGLSAGLRLVLAEPAVGPFLLIVRARSLLAPGLRFQCGVSVNDRPIGQLTFVSNGASTFTFLIGVEVIGQDRVVAIVFENESVHRIADLTQAKTDERRVGIGVEFVVLADIGFLSDPLTYLDAGERDMARQLVGRWITLEPAAIQRRLLHGAWTGTSWGFAGATGRSSLMLTVHEDPEAEIVVECRVRAVATPTSAQSVLVLANNAPVASWRFLDDSICVREFRIPPEVRHKQQPIAVEFVAREERSPAALQIGSETRAIVFGLFELRYGTARLFKQREDAWQLLAPAYPVGKLIGFQSSVGAEEISAAPYLQDGWLPAESDGTWTLGSSGRLRLRLAAPLQGSALLDVKLRGFGTLELGPTTVHVAINRHAVLAVELSTDAECGATGLLSADLLAGGQDLRIEVTAGRVRSPFGVQQSEDDRLLGVQLSSMRLRPVIPLALGRPMDLSRPEIVEAVVTQGWYRPEPEGLWSRGRLGTIYVDVPANIDLASLGGSQKPGRRRGRTDAVAARLLAVFRVVYASEKAPVTIGVAINDEPCGEVVTRKSTFNLLDLPVPLHLLKPGAGLKIEFDHPLATSPEALHISDDPRVLGVMVSGFAIATAETAREITMLLPGIQRVAEFAPSPTGEDEEESALALGGAGADEPAAPSETATAEAPVSSAASEKHPDLAHAADIVPADPAEWHLPVGDQ